MTCSWNLGGRAWSEEPQRIWSVPQVPPGWFIWGRWGKVTGKPSSLEIDRVDWVDSEISVSGGMQVEVITWWTYHIRASSIQMGRGIEVSHPALGIHNSRFCKGDDYSKLEVFLPIDHHSVFQQTSPSINSLDTQSQSLP